jgi:hypothetical protein
MIRSTAIASLNPDPVTAAAVKARREATGRGMQECKRELEHERLLVLIQMFDLTGDRRQLTEILFKLAEERR